MSTPDIIAALVCVGLLALLVVFIARTTTGGASTRSSGGAFLTGFQDFLPKDKQEAIEMMIRKKAGTKEFGESGSEGPKKAGSHHEHE